MAVGERSNSHTRDAALEQLRRLNRWLLAGSVVLTGVLTEAAAHAFPGRTVKPSADSAAKSSSRQSRDSAAKESSSAKATSTSGEALQAPASSPRSSGTEGSSGAEPAQAESSGQGGETSAPVVSGGS